MQAKLKITFERLGEEDFLSKAELINNSLASNLNFPPPWPTPQLSNPAALTTLFTGYQAAYNAAATHDDIKMAARKTARTALTTYLKKLAPYLEVIANGDLGKLLSSGYSLRKDTAHTGGNVPPPAPENFMVERGSGGQLIAKARKLKNVDAYEVQINVGDPNLESGWHPLSVQTSCVKIKINGLTPMTTVWVRLRGVNSDGPGAWTPPASAVVL